MKYVCKQVNPEYQESPMFNGNRISLDDNLCYMGLYLIPTDHCYGIRNEELKELTDRFIEICDEWENITEGYSHYYDTITECVNAYLPRQDGKSYSTQKIHAFKELTQNFDEDDNDCICQLLEIVYGGSWDWTAIRGCCQGDYAEVIYDTDAWTDKAIEAIEAEYFNTGSEWECDLEGTEDTEEITENSIGDSIYTYAYSWNDEDIKQELAESIGCNVEDVVMFKYSGSHYTPEYERV